MERLFGLIGYPLGHSFSKKYFSGKFEREGIDDARFELFPLEQIGQFRDLIANHPGLQGLSVTIPYKQQVIPFLDELDETARAVGAVNSIRISRRNEKPWLKGFNTDIYGFEKSLDQHKFPVPPRALVFGTGGASKAVCYVLEQKKWDYFLVSRKPSGPQQLDYKAITEELIGKHLLLINTTPLGMYPHTGQCPPIPYQALTASHLAFDLVYNPPLTLFLQKAAEYGGRIQNGEDMLVWQAEKSWELWNAED